MTGNSGWIPFQGSMVVGRGYCVKMATGATMSFSGTLNHLGSSYNATYTINNPTVNSKPLNDKSRGANYIGNPFTAAIKATDFLLNNGLGYLYFYNGVNDDGTYSSDERIVCNGTGSTGSIFPFGSKFAGKIGPCQGFYINVPEGGKTITFDPAWRIPSDDANNTLIKTKENDGVQRIKLYVAGPDNKVSDILVGCLDKATIDEDFYYDAPRGRTEGSFSFYSMIGDKSFSIQGLPVLRSGASHIVPLGLSAAKAGNYTFKCFSFENIDELSTVYLQDMEKDTLIEFKPGANYNVKLAQGFHNDRFRLIFNKPRILTENTGNQQTSNNDSTPRQASTLTTSVNDLNLLYINIYSHKDAVIITKNINQSAYVEIFDLTGKLILKQSFNDNYKSITFNHQVGIYFVKLSVNGKLLTKKVVLE
jgi:hypothetical protein